MKPEDDRKAERPDEPLRRSPDDIAEIVRRSRAACGLPEFIEDDEALDNFWALVAAAIKRRNK